MSTIGYHHLEQVAKVCLVGPDASAVAKKLCQTIYTAIVDHGESINSCKALVKYLFKEQTVIALDEFVGEHKGDNRKIDFYLLNDRFPINEAPVDSVISWAQLNPDQRYLRLASIISPVVVQNEQEMNRWSDIALKIIDKAPDKAAVIDALSSHLCPNSWSGSRATIIEGRRSLAKALFQHSDPIVVEQARVLDARLHEWAEGEAERERSRSRNLDERFE